MLGDILTVLSPETLIRMFSLSSESVDCSGIRLHLDKVYRFLERGHLRKSSRSLPKVEEVPCTEGGIYKLSPGAYKIRYLEYVKIPEDAIGIALPRSSLLRMGATIFSAVWDPGYEGRGEGLLVVFNEHGVELERGVQIAQLVFIKMDKATRYLYRGMYFKENVEGT